MKNIHVLLILLGFVAWSCEEGEIEPALPHVRTLPIAELNDDGATFRAEIKKFPDQGIIDYGFIWSEISYNAIEDFPMTAYRISLGTNPDTGAFSRRIMSNWEEEKWYHVRAYIRTNDAFFWGNEVSFFLMREL
jgi:hypothetical protein